MDAVKVRRGAMSDPSATYELWLFWRGRWERRAVGYGCGLRFATAGYGEVDPAKLELRVRDDHTSQMPEGLEWLDADKESATQ